MSNDFKSVLEVRTEVKSLNEALLLLMSSWLQIIVCLFIYLFKVLKGAIYHIFEPECSYFIVYCGVDEITNQPTISLSLVSLSRTLKSSTVAESSSLKPRLSTIPIQLTTSVRARRPFKRTPVEYII